MRHLLPLLQRVRARALAALLVLAVLAIAAPAGAQVGSTTDIITGHVVGADSLPIEGAHVEVTSAETGITRRTVTRADGRYSLIFRDGGGRYRLRITSLGMAPATLQLQRSADEDRLVANVRMGRSVSVLAAVKVTAKTPAPPGGRVEAGGTERAYSPALLEALPIQAGDLAAIATLAPGVVAVAGSDSSPASFSVAGQPSNQNRTTVDGAGVLFGTLPQDAVRTARVVTNSYDVSRGQYLGGQVNTTTRGGTNDLQGTLNLTHHDPSLRARGGGPSFGQSPTDNLLSGGLGGPLVRDHAYFFASGSLQRRQGDRTSLLDESATTLDALGLAADTVVAFRRALAGLGVDPFAGAPGDLQFDDASALARVDYDLGDAHSLMVRGDWRRSTQSAARIGPFSVPSAGGRSSASGGGGLASLTSDIGSVINEARASLSTSDRRGTPFAYLPFAVTTVRSALAGGGLGASSLQFGGNPGLPARARSSLAEVADEVSWLTPGNAHRLKLGALYTRDRSSAGVVPNAAGTFVFSSLDDLAAGRAAAFTRTLGGAGVPAGTDNLAVYLGDSWRRSAKLQLTYGVRAEGTRLPDVATHDAALDAAFGLGGRVPDELHVSPRFGFTYLTSTEAGLPTGSVRGGVGEFRGRTPSELVGLARGISGSQVACVGDAVPAVDWAAFAASSASIPDRCADADGGALAPVRAPDATLLGRDFGAPRVWRASLGSSRRFGDKYGANVEATYAYGSHGASAYDANLGAPAASLASEGGRPLFAAPDAVVPATGAVAMAASRRLTQYGEVAVIGSQLHSRTAQLTVGGSRSFPLGAFVSTSYTYTRSRDQSNGFGAGAYLPTTAGDPARIEWGPSDLERRHSVIATAIVPATRWADLSLIGRFNSNARYTPLVSGDVNADGARNDRAFVFDPGTSRDTALTAPLARLLANGPARVRDCLARQLGRVAARNSCDAGWSSGLDSRLIYRVPGLDHRVTMSLLASNLTAGVDQLLHGQAGERGWGQPSIPDRTLLYVRGFDPASGAYRYQVNERFGTRAGGASPYRVPFEVALQAHVAIGLTPERQQIRQVLGNADGKPPTINAVKERLAAQIPNPYRQILDVADSVRPALSAPQRARLTTLADSLGVRIDTLLGQFATILVAAGPSPDPNVIGPKLQPLSIEARRLLERAVADAHTQLDAAQWASLPERVRLPFAQPQSTGRSSRN